MDEHSIATLLQTLTVEEQAIIKPVLERDLEFQRREKLRLQELREQTVERKLSLLSSRSQESFASSLSASVSPSSPSYRGCLTCGVKLGFILHTGGRCKKCDQQICENCKCYTSKDRTHYLCQLCFQERELQAASGEWVSSRETDPTEQLLTHMRKAATDRNRSISALGEAPAIRHPRMNRRNMTLPSLSVMTLLSVPTEAEATEGQRHDVTRRFWGGSPSPRSPSPRPVSAGSSGVFVVAPTPPPNSLIPGLHPREVIGSPSPRSAPPFITSPMCTKLLPLTEVEAPTPTTPVSPSPIAEARRREFVSQKSSTVYQGINRLLPIDLRERPQKLLRRAPKIVTDAVLLDEWVLYRSPSPSGSQGSSDFLNNNDSRRPSAISTLSTNYRRRMKKSISKDTESTCSGCDSQASSQPTFVGEICLSCQYDPATATLRLVVPQCRSLPHFGRHRPNPYVRLELSAETDGVIEFIRKTSTKYVAVDPFFEESFQFTNMSKSSLERRRLTASVWHKERLAADSLIGETSIWLRDVRWHQPAPLWLPFQTVDSHDEEKATTVNFRLAFKIRDKERGIGTLTISLMALEPKIRSELQVQISLFFREQKLTQRQGALVYPSPFLAVFPAVNIHDLHLRSARIRLNRRVGFWKQATLTEIDLNAWNHNITRRTGCPCGCQCCQPWHKLTEKPYKDQSFGVAVLMKKSQSE